LANSREKGAGGAQAKLLEDTKPEPWVYLRLDTKNGFRYGGMTGDDLAKFASADRHAYEIVPTSRKRKFYLDYDQEVHDTQQGTDVHDAALSDLQAKACADAVSVCGPGRAVLSGSWGVKHDKVKYSVHLVRPDRYFPNHEASMPMPAIAKSLGADPNVYGRNQLFKLPKQSKLRDSRVQNLITGDIKEHILTAFFDTQASEMTLEDTPPPAPGATRRKAAKAASLKVPLAPWIDQEAPIPEDWAMSSPALETLRLIRHNTDAGHRLTRTIRYMIMGWCRHRDGVSFDDFLQWIFQGKEDTPERRARYSEDWRAWAGKRPPPNNKIEAVLATLYPDVCFTNKDARIYRQTHALKTTRVVTGFSSAPRGQMTITENLQRQRFLRELKENGPKFLGTDDFGTERAVLFHVPMGKGKTTQIRGILERGERSLILTHRTTLTGDIHAHCRGTTDLKHYSHDFKGRDNKHKMAGANQLICQLESIRHLHGAKPYTYLMIDESQLLFMQASSETFKQTEDVRMMWEVLSYLIRSAKYVRCYDGFMGRTTSDVLKGLGILDAAVVRMPASIPDNGRTMIMQAVNQTNETKEWLKAWAADIGAQVATGKNVMVFYPFKHEKPIWPSMTQMMALICDEGGIDISDTVMHYGGMDSAEKNRILSNINENWKVRVVMTNTAVTAGVDFNVPDWFDRLYACISGFQNPREIVQWLSRARHIKENKVYVVKICAMFVPKAVPDRLNGSDDTFHRLIANINTELGNHKRSVLECFAIDAGYKIKFEKTDFSQEVLDAAKAFELTPDTGVLYDNIKPLSERKADFLQQRVAAQAATTTETLRLAKYFFDKLFKPEVDTDTKGAFWDSGMVGTAQSIQRYRDPGCSLRAILPDVCAKLDSILITADAIGAKAAVEDAFSGNLDAATFRAINTRYPELTAECTSDKRLLNKVAAEACGTEIWKRCNKDNKWIINDTKLSLAADLFASVAPSPSELTSGAGAARWGFLGDPLSSSEGGGSINALPEHFYKDSLESALIEPPSEPSPAAPRAHWSAQNGSEASQDFYEMTRTGYSDPPDSEYEITRTGYSDPPDSEYDNSPHMDIDW
jgi:hypothetical protein